MKFEELEFKPHPRGFGIQALVQFPNGYCASVVKNEFSYGGERGLYELAVGFGPVDGAWEIVYDTPITGDVLGHLVPEAVTVVLADIAALPPREVAP